MKFATLCFLAVLIACNPKMGSQIITKQPPLDNDEYVLVLKVNDDFVNDGVKVGTIKSGDNGFSTNCTYYEVINTLKKAARQNGANVIKITDRKFPDRQSTCDRIVADIYRVPDYKKHEIEILWQEGRLLTWNDFKGEAPEGYHKFAAVTQADIEVESNAVNLFTKARFFTKATFHCYLSWVKENAKQSDELLKHEQIHFDLVEIYRRMLQKKLNETKYDIFNLESARKESKDYFKLYEKRAAQYDEETNHGLIKDKQLEWNEKVAAELYDLKDYESVIQ